MIYLMPFLMSMLNRLRGSGVFNDWLSRIAKVTTPVLIFSLCTDGNGFIGTFLLFAYLLGESLGWGKWVATLCDRQPRYNEEEGHTFFTLFGKVFDFWDGIHHIANLIVKETKDFLNYSRVALAIRGFYWWFPVLLVLKLYSQIGWFDVLWASTTLSASFPLSIELARKIKFIDNNWEKGEFIYGLFYGLVFMLLIIF